MVRRTAALALLSALLRWHLNSLLSRCSLSGAHWSLLWLVSMPLSLVAAARCCALAGVTVGSRGRSVAAVARSRHLRLLHCVGPRHGQSNSVQTLQQREGSWSARAAVDCTPTHALPFALCPPSVAALPRSLLRTARLLPATLLRHRHPRIPTRHWIDRHRSIPWSRHDQEWEKERGVRAARPGCPSVALRFSLDLASKQTNANAFNLSQLRLQFAIASRDRARVQARPARKDS